MYFSRRLAELTLININLIKSEDALLSELELLKVLSLESKSSTLPKFQFGPVIQSP